MTDSEHYWLQVLYDTPDVDVLCVIPVLFVLLQVYERVKIVHLMLFCH